MGYKSGELLAVQHAHATGAYIPKKALRVKKVKANDVARSKGIHIPKNMRVPNSSVISKCYHSGVREATCENEDLSSWSFSDGKALAPRVVSVSVRHLGTKVVAILQTIPLGRLQPKLNRSGQISG